MDQSQIVAFLSTAEAFRAAGETIPEGTEVETVETHGARIFLCGNTALKLKRSVVYDYMDLGSVEQRHAMLLRELELNAPAAPMIYRDVLPVTRQEGGLTLGGDEPALDWVLRMWRFPAENEFEALVERGAFDDGLATATGEAIAAYHAAAPQARRPGADLIADILAELGRVFAEFPGAAGTDRADDWLAASSHALAKVRPLLDARGARGHVRRVHGDLHLRNLVLIEGQPVLFDALEFDETLGTCDLLYDVAFLIMDLCHRDLRRQACRVLDAWLREARGAEDSGLAALPLFMSVRAAIRAIVMLQTDAAQNRPGASSGEIAAFLDLGHRALRPGPARLIAVGGFSGTGKSVLARGLAPKIGTLPGAVLLSSDMERKAGLPKDRTLEADRYTHEGREAVYRVMFVRAEAILRSGHSVLVDATFLDAGLRRRLADLARRREVAFQGLWLEAPRAVLEARVEARHGGPSDADLRVLRGQLERSPGKLDWQRLDAAAMPDVVLWAACEAVGVAAEAKDASARLSDPMS